ncbi:MAG: hypothetical protein Fur005_40590 [Roseiflexaceae bacterium]
MINISQVLKQLREAAATAEATAKQAQSVINTAATQAYEAVAPTLEHLNTQMNSMSAHAVRITEENLRATTEYIKEHAPTLAAEAEKVLSIDEAGRAIAALGMPAIAFAVAASIAGGMGLAGGAVITTALAMLGGPVGMVGGLLALGTLSTIASVVAKYGIDAILVATFTARQESGITNEQIHTDIDQLWISDELKLKLKNQFPLV